MNLNNLSIMDYLIMACFYNGKRMELNVLIRNV